MKTEDYDIRTRAVSEQGSFIVQAPAGSGKTELLSRRFLRLLSTVDKPERVLAITFTRKATQEMRERIMLRLSQAGKNEPVGDEHELQAVKFAAEVLQRSAELGWNLLENPGRLQIHTIDGLCARISGRSIQAATGVSGLTVLEDAKPLYLEAARRLIEDAGQIDAEPGVFKALTRVLVYLRGSAAILQDLLCSMLGRRDQWLSRMGVRHQDMTALLATQQKIELEMLNDALGEDLLDALAMSLESIAAKSANREKADTLLHALQRAKTEPDRLDFSVAALFHLLKTVATVQNKPFSPRSVKSRVLPGDQEISTDQLESVKQVLGTWNESALASAAFTRFVACPPMAASQDAQAVLSDFQLLLKYATAQLRVLFIEKSKADFIYVSELALQALGDELVPGDALLVEDGSLEHILLDEFQDTSHTQFELISTLISGWQADDGRSLFLVGDPMQSIYRFRKADVSIFNRVFQNGMLGTVPVEPLHLVSNFRSAPEIIDWINIQFPRVFAEPDYYSPNFVGYSPFRAELHDSGQVLAHPYFEGIGAMGEAELIADLVTKTKQSSPDISIAVLAKARVQLETIAQALYRRNIDFEAVQIEDLRSRPVIIDLITILRAIIHPADRIAWLSLLRAPWCALNPDELHTVAGPTKDSDIFARLADADVIGGLSTDKRARLHVLHEIMRSAFGARDGVPLSRLIEVAWLRLKGPFMVGAADELDNASLFFSLLASVEAEHPQDLLFALNARMDCFYSASKQSSLKLMTIHKAKGLEFDMVILPGLHRAGHRRDLPMLRVQEIRAECGEGVLMAPRKRKDVNDPGLYDYLGLLESEQEALEASRVLYVASTRARSELHLFGAWKWNKIEQKAYCAKGSLLEKLWPFFEPLTCTASEPVLEIKNLDVTPPLVPQLYLDNEPELAISPSEPQALQQYPELRIPDADSVALGQAFHCWMELIHDHWDHGWSASWLEQNIQTLESTLKSAGASPKNLPELLQKLVSLITSTLEDDRGSNIVCPEGKAGSWAEIAFLSRAGMDLKLNILDRLYLDQLNQFVIVDYKTGEAPPGLNLSWQTQLEEYKELVELSTGLKVNHAEIFQPKMTQ